MRWACALALLLATGCGDEGREVEVVLVGDLRPVLDFSEVRVELQPIAAEGARSHTAGPTAPERTVDLREGLSVATLDGVVPGDYHAVVSLTDVGGAYVARGVTRFTVRAEDARVQVQITRACVGVMCPDEARPRAEDCSAGVCVDARCSPTSRAYCPPPQCVEDADCPASADGPACLSPVCLSGECGLWPDDSRCVSGTCDPAAGCDLVVLDAGIPDAGAPDAGMPDAGCTAMPESCNAIDDDCNGLVDDGDVCPCPVFENRGSTYALCNATANWNDARAACQTYAYDLAVLSTAQEQTEVHDLVRARIDNSYWIGLGDLAEEGVFAWVDGSRLTDDSWNAGEPNAASADEDCVHAQPMGTWNDARCVQTFRYLCEVP